MSLIYCLEDDLNIREMVVYALATAGFEAKGFECPDGFFAAMAERLPELILLDIMLPEKDGITVLKQLRRDSKTAKLPVIMLTAKGGEFDKVTGLDAGADDYVVKPFGVLELISRVKALLRRTGSEKIELSIGEVLMDDKRHIVTVSGKKVELTLKEYELLKALLKHKSEAMARERLLSEVWGIDFLGETRTLDMHIKTLRQKLECDVIKTVRGVGYKAEQ